MSVYDIVSGRTLAELLEVSPETICDWRKAGVIPCIYINGKVIRYDLAEVVEALKSPRGDGPRILKLVGRLKSSCESEGQHEP